MQRKYLSVSEIRLRWPGVKAWILQNPAGRPLLLRNEDKDPTGVYCLLGIIE
jgi:hypothetical protein